MSTLTVSPAILREKARLIRAVLDENKSTHQQIWGQITTQVTNLPRSLVASHNHANSSWNKGVKAHYDNYYKVALAMEAAADAYEKGDQDVQKVFDSFQW